jgi:hypothetical protein
MKILLMGFLFCTGCAHFNSPICEAKELLFECEEVCSGKVEDFQAKPDSNSIRCECKSEWKQ